MIEGLGGTLRLGKVSGPVGGADMGMASVRNGYGLGGASGAVDGGQAFSSLSLGVVVGDASSTSTLHEQSDRSLLQDSGVVWPEGGGGDAMGMSLERKSV